MLGFLFVFLIFYKLICNFVNFDVKKIDDKCEFKFLKLCFIVFRFMFMIIEEMVMN